MIVFRIVRKTRIPIKNRLLGAQVFWIKERKKLTTDTVKVFSFMVVTKCLPVKDTKKSCFLILNKKKLAYAFLFYIISFLPKSILPPSSPPLFDLMELSLFFTRYRNFSIGNYVCSQMLIYRTIHYIIYSYRCEKGHGCIEKVGASHLLSIFWTIYIILLAKAVLSGEKRRSYSVKI